MSHVVTGHVMLFIANEPYLIPTRKMARGAVLDSPLKGKPTETCVVEGVMRVCPAPFKDQSS